MQLLSEKNNFIYLAGALVLLLFTGAIDGNKIVGVFYMAILVASLIGVRMSDRDAASR